VTLEAPVKRVHVIQGEFKVSDDPNVVLSTILGSCVAACMRDPVASVGGMNHFLLPGQGNGTGGEATRYGVHLMELLINGLLKKGAAANALKPKLSAAPKPFGILKCRREECGIRTSVPQDEGIRIVGSNVGGDVGRKLEYFPVSGRARQYPLTGAETQKTVALETSPPKIMVPKPAVDTSIEFF
jgi:chemotaxis protein CheD